MPASQPALADPGWTGGSHCKPQLTVEVVEVVQGVEDELPLRGILVEVVPEMFHPPKMPQRQRNSNRTGFQRVPVENPLNADVAPVAHPFFQPLLTVVCRC